MSGREILPLSGVSNSPTMLCNEVGRHVIYTSDEHGFRNRAGSWSEPVDVLVIGDSFAHGVCVEDAQTLPGLLRAAGLRALSAAYSGNGPLLELATIREYAMPVKPRVVVWTLYEGNDLDVNLPLEARSPLLMQYLNEGSFRQDLFSRQQQLDQMLLEFVGRNLRRLSESDPARRQAARYSGLLDLSPLREFTWQLTDPPTADFPLFERVLQAAQRDVASWGGELVLLYLPDPARFGDGGGMLHRQAIRRADGYHAEVRAITGRVRVPFLDALPALTAAVRPEAFIPYPFVAHYSPDGYAVAAQPLIEWIAARRSTW